MRTRTKRTGSPRPPVPRAYRRMLEDAAARPEECEVDRTIARSARVQRLRRRARRFETRAQARHPDQKAFIRYADARTGLETARSEAYFDAGHERGRLSGHAEHRGAGADGRSLIHGLCSLALGSKLPAPVVIAALLDTARGMVMRGSGRPAVAVRSRRGNRGRERRQ